MGAGGDLARTADAGRRRGAPVADAYLIRTTPGKRRQARPPRWEDYFPNSVVTAMTMTIDRTAAKTGRSMKKRAKFIVSPDPAQCRLDPSAHRTTRAGYFALLFAARSDPAFKS